MTNNHYMLTLFKQVLFVLIFQFVLQGTVYAQSYFQQRTDYKIRATLDTLDKTLTGDIILSYTNNSPEELDEIYFHVWWNAYSDKKSAYAQQSIEIGNRNFYFSDSVGMGGYTELEFKYQGAAIAHKPHVIDEEVQADIVVIQLKEPIKPNATVEFDIDFKSKIPYAFSRAGYRDQLYRMTQWYPKPAVYDDRGWHPMPYLEMGEYYSEFGDYDVELNIPASHSIESTGIIDESRTEYSSSGKLLHIKAKNVIDFAWFCSEYYLPYRGSVNVEGEDIGVNIFVHEDNEKWEEMMVFAKRAVEFYSEEIGLYPYPKVTIVAENSGNGSGMEYPMITLIDSDNTPQVLDHLITHEIGHNWFQAILASDERRYTWMDEGINTYYEEKYIDQYYKYATYDDVPDLWRKKDRDYSILQSAIINLERTNRNTIIDKESKDFDVVNYISMNYEKMAWSYKYLAHYLGEDVFKKGIQLYFKEWQFKHPMPHDIQSALEQVSNKNLDWFFRDYIGTKNHINLSINKLKSTDSGYDVIIENRGSFSIPYAITAYDGEGKLLYEEWQDSPQPNSTELVNIPHTEAKKVAINGEVKFVDVNYSDNVKYTNKPIIGKPVKFNFLGGLENNDVHSINVFPSILFNQYDGLMLGTALTNSVFPIKNTRWFVAPNYGLKSGRLSGNFKIEKDLLSEKSNFRKWTLGLFGQTFSYRNFQDLNLTYHKITPEITMHMSQGIFKNSYLQYKAHIINQDILDFDDGNPFVDSEWSVIHQLNFNMASRRRLSQSDMLIQLEYENYDKPFGDRANYLKLSVTNDRSIFYNENSQFHIRFFGGYFIKNSERESSSYSNVFSKASFALTSQGFTDHLFEELYFARSGQNNNDPSSQVTIAEGGFKNAFGAGFTTGFSNNYLLTANLKIDLPLNFLQDINVRPYIDLAYTSTKEVTADPLQGQFLYSGGLSIEISDAIGIYVPLINSAALKSNYSGTKIWDRISFMYNLKAFNPWVLQDDPGRLF